MFCSSQPYFVKYLQIYHWARLLVRELVRSIGGTRFSHEDMHMHQAFYVQDLGCNTTCKNAWKVSHTLDVDLSCFHSICKGILSAATFGPKITFFGKIVQKRHCGVLSL